MRLANLDGRATIVTDAGGVDVATASGGRFGPDVHARYDDWAALRAPAGVRPGAALENWIEGIATMRHRLVAG